MFILDDILIGIPVFASIYRAFSKGKEAKDFAEAKTGSGEKTVGGCGGDPPAAAYGPTSSGNWGEFAPMHEAPAVNVKAVGGPGKTVGGSGCSDPRPAAYGPTSSGNWGDFAPMYEAPTVNVKAVAGPGAPGEGYAMTDYAMTELPGYEQAHEVFEEKDVDLYKTVSGPAHASSTHSASAPSAPAPSEEELEIVKKGILAAVREGDYDAPAWTQLTVGDYDIMVMNEPLSVHGLRLPASLDDAIEVAKVLDAIPITPQISEARWANAKHIFAKPLDPPKGGLHDLVQVVEYNQKIGPNTGELTDGYWKEQVIVPGMKPEGRGSMAQYGFHDSETHMFQSGGPGAHERAYKDYSLTPTYVGRKALKGGVEVDLVDELAEGGPLGGPLPAWLVERLNG